MATSLRDQQDEGKGQVEEERNDHCFRDDCACVLDLLGHVRN